MKRRSTLAFGIAFGLLATTASSPAYAGLINDDIGQVAAQSLAVRSMTIDTRRISSLSGVMLPMNEANAEDPSSPETLPYMLWKDVTFDAGNHDVIVNVGSTVLRRGPTNQPIMYEVQLYASAPGATAWTCIANAAHSLGTLSDHMTSGWPGTADTLTVDTNAIGKTIHVVLAAFAQAPTGWTLINSLHLGDTTADDSAILSVPVYTGGGYYTGKTWTRNGQPSTRVYFEYHPEGTTKGVRYRFNWDTSHTSYGVVRWPSTLPIPINHDANFWWGMAFHNASGYHAGTVDAFDETMPIWSFGSFTLKTARNEPAWDFTWAPKAGM